MSVYFWFFASILLHAASAKACFSCQNTRSCEENCLLQQPSFLPAFIGFWVGVLFLLLLDRLIPYLHVGSNQAEGPKSRLDRTTMMVLAVTLHNIPEGMAVGVMYAGFLAGNARAERFSAVCFPALSSLSARC